MLDVSDKAEPADQKLFEGVQNGLIDIDDLAALLADEVVMVVVALYLKEGARMPTGGRA